jgi:hypothetical protein
MGTSTADIVHSSEQNTERPESSPGELIVTTENNANSGMEITSSALQNGKLDFFFIDMNEIIF